MAVTSKDILAQIKEQDVKYVDVRFTDIRGKGAHKQFLVKWVGYSVADCTWESAKRLEEDLPKENFDHLRDSLLERKSRRSK